jgi:hypothetical protein
MRSADRVLDLAEDQRVLLAVGVLTDAIARDREGTGIGDLMSLLVALARGDQGVSAKIIAILKDAPIDLVPVEVDLVPEKTVESLSKVVALMQGHLQELGLLACRWDRLGTAACAEKPSVLQWQAINEGIDQVTPLPSVPGAPIAFDVSGLLDRGLIFEPNPEIPAELAAAGTGSVRLGLRGKVKSSASAAIPIRFGSIGLAAENEGTARIDWFVARREDRFVASSFAAALRELANPFDLAALSAAFAGHRLLGVSVDAGGGFGLGGTLSIGVTDPRLGEIAAKLGIDLAFHSSRRGEFRLSVRPAGAESTDPKAVRVDIVRTRVAEDATSAAIGLSMDLSPVLERLRPNLLANTGKAQALLTELQDFVPPSRVVRGELQRQIENLVASPNLRAVLGAALGSSEEASDLDRLRQRLEGAIDAQADLWQADISSLADRAAGQAIDGLPLLKDDRVLLRSASKMVTEQALGTLRDGLKRELTLRTSDRIALDGLRTAIEQAGERVDRGLGLVDALSAPVTSQLDRFQRTLAKITQAIQHSGEVKLNARWRSQELRGRGSAVDQSLLFHPDHPEAAALFRQTLTGSIEALFDFLARQGLQTQRTGPVTLIEGTLQTFANVHKASGTELTLLDFRLGSQGLLDAEVVIETDASGNLRVCTRSESHWSRWRPAERSDFQAVNVFELASVRQTRRMCLSLSLSQIHQDLRDREIREFFAGLADRRIALLASDDVSTALQRLPDAGTRRSGELRAWLELDEPALFRLLRLSDPSAGVAANALTDRDEVQIYETAVDAMVAGLSTTGSRTDYANLRHYLASNRHGDDLAAVLKQMRLESKRYAFAPHPAEEGLQVSSQPQYDRLERIVKRAEGLVKAIKAMREIYYSEPGRGWSLGDYQRRQEDIDAAVIFWVRGEPVDRGWWAVVSGKDSIGPYMLSFFKAIADLCRGSAGPDAVPPLLASIVIPQSSGDEEIMLTTGRPQPPLGAVDTLASPNPTNRIPTVVPPPSRRQLPEPQQNNDDQRRREMPELIFPLEKKVTTYHTGSRRFRSSRPGGRLHAGCDLLAPQHTKILAMADGVVIRGPYPFYDGTYALEVAHELPGNNQVLVRYGEINQRVPKGIKPGERVTQGQLIATVGRLLSSGKSMLHLEMYSDGSNRGPLTVLGLNKFKRRKDVFDPTPRLDAASISAPIAKEDAGAGATTQQSSTEAKIWKGVVDPLNVTTVLNVRPEPKIELGAAPKFRLDPRTVVDIIGAEEAGPYPFGQGNLWFEIRHGGQTGFVAAFFIDTDYPVAGGRGLEKDAELGYVSRLEGGLNIRAAPATDAEILYKLPKGTEVAILSQHAGGVYDSNRNDWLRVRDEAHAQDGYAAAYYIDVGVKDAVHGIGPADRDNMNRWERALAETEWAGASGKTASGQLGRGTPGGVPASEALAQRDLARVKRVAGVFADVAAKFGVPAALLAGIASRESRCGIALANGWGDRGNAFGIMQVDKNFHAIRNTADPCGIDHVEQATGIFATNLEALLGNSRCQGWEDRYLLQGATAAYNFGLRNVRTKAKIDEGTTGDDYGADVLARAKYFYKHPDLHLLRG